MEIRKLNVILIKQATKQRKTENVLADLVKLQSISWFCLIVCKTLNHQGSKTIFLSF